MDNASKALIMAGGILIAVMIISASMYILTSARGLASTANKEMEESARESYNRYYKSFNSTITGIDVLNIYNKAEDDKWRNDSNFSVHYAKFNPSIDSIVSKLDAPDGVKYMKELYTYSYSDTDSDGYIDTISIQKK